jgi:Flp pilus assembly protein TadB
LLVERRDATEPWWWRKQMSDTTNSAISIGVAAIGAMATIAAAYFSSAKERQNERAQIVQDIEIVQKLPDVAPAKEILQSYIENRAALLPLEKEFRSRALNGLFAFVATLVGIVVLYLTQFTELPIKYYWSGVLALIVLFMWIHNNDRKKLIERFVSERGLPSGAVEPFGDRPAKSSVTWRFWKRGNR